MIGYWHYHVRLSVRLSVCNVVHSVKPTRRLQVTLMDQDQREVVT